jgi:hypothetical protein
MLRRPSIHAEMYPVIHSLDIDVVDPQIRAIEPLLEVGQGTGLDVLMYLRHIYHRVVFVYTLEIGDDIVNRRLRALKIHPVVSLNASMRADQGPVITVYQFAPSIQGRDVPFGHFVDRLVDLRRTDR